MGLGWGIHQASTLQLKRICGSGAGRTDRTTAELLELLHRLHTSGMPSSKISPMTNAGWVINKPVTEGFSAN